MRATSAVDVLAIGFASLQDDEQAETLARLRDIQLTRLTEAEGEAALHLRALRRVADLNGGDLTPDIYKRTRASLSRDETLPTLSAVIRYYRTWAMAKEAVGLAETTTAEVIEARFKRRLRGQHPHYQSFELEQALAGCVAELGRVPLVSEYEEWRSKELALARTRGEVGRVPGAESFRRRFGGWEKALLGYGYSTEEVYIRLESAERSFERAKVWRYTDATLGAALCACARELGRAPLVAEYAEWRRRKLGEAGQPVDLPSDSPFRRRYGSWVGALRHFGFDDHDIRARLVDGRERSRVGLLRHRFR